MLASLPIRHLLFCKFAANPSHHPKHGEHDQNLSMLEQFLKDNVLVVCAPNARMSYELWSR